MSFERGALVRLRERRDRHGVIVDGPKQFGGRPFFKVQHPTGGPKSYSADQLELVEGGATDIDRLLADQAFSTPESLDRVVTFTRLRQPLTDTLYAFRATRTDFLEYQYIPLLKFLDSPSHRLLIADEVGLGKTIEAGLILTELEARLQQSMKRVLVVCPSRLCWKWQEELMRRFEQDFEILNARQMLRFLEKSVESQGQTPLRGICSFESLRIRVDDFEAAAPPFDLVIVDEAHHMRNRETLTNRLGRHLGQISSAMLLLTATPVHLGNKNLYHLLEIMEPDEFTAFTTLENRLRNNQGIHEAIRLLGHEGEDAARQAAEQLDAVEATQEGPRLKKSEVYGQVRTALTRPGELTRAGRIEAQRHLSSLHLLSHVMTRTLKRDVEESRSRREAHTLRFPFRPDEQRFYDAVTEMLSERGPGARLGLITRQRQVASSIHGFVRHIQSAAEDAFPDDSDLEQMEQFEADEPDEELAALVASWNADAPDSKLEQLLGILEQIEANHPGTNVLVFAYFKGTVRYLEEQLLKRGVSCVSLSSDVQSTPSRPETDERRQAVERFRDDSSVRVMVSTEVGGEGLDFQFCSALVNYDLPWNPMVVEQRIGRIDRHGQQSEVMRIYNLSVENTVEDVILQRLYQRIGIFEGSIGDMEVILGEVVSNLSKQLFRQDLTDEQRAEQVELAADAVERRFQQQRALESESSRLFGHDEFVRDQIRRIQTGGKYVAGDALARLHRDFLRTCCEDSGLHEEQGGIYRLRASPRLLQIVRDRSPAYDRETDRFLSRFRRNEARVTFDQSVAYEQPEVQFITGHHPLTRALVAELEARPDALHTVTASKLLVDAEEPPAAAGTYVFKGILVTTEGARESRRFEVLMVNLETGEALDELVAQQLINEAAARGQPWESGLTEPPLLEDRIESLNALVMKRVEDIQKRMREENDTIIDNRLASLEQSYRARDESLKKLIRAGERKQHSENIQRMRRAQLDNVRRDAEEKRTRLEDRRGFTVNHEDVCAGVVEIVHVEMPA